MTASPSLPPFPIPSPASLPTVSAGGARGGKKKIASNLSVGEKSKGGNKNKNVLRPVTL